MNRLNISQISWAIAVLFLGTGAMLALGGGLAHAMLVLAVGVLVLLITAHGDAEPALPAVEPLPPPDPIADQAFGALMEAVSDPLMLIGKGRVLRANRAALRLLGAHIVGEDARIAIRHPAAAERLSSSAPLAEPDSIELVGVGTREQRWFMRIVQLASSEEGEARRMVHLVDRSSAYAAERMRVDFVANASHELRTPLAGILGFIETLTDPELGKDKDTRLRFLKIMDGEARRMQRLVDDLMSLSRIEAEKYRAPDTAIDLAELVAEVVGVFRSSHGDRGRDVEMDIAPALAPVRGDRAQLSQLLHNLIGNSAKYGREGTPIQVRLSAGPTGMVRLHVADEGEGIGPDHLPRLTERFYRVDSGRSRAMGGTGLGLAIVKHIVERHRGRLDISSTLGRGTTISVLVPVAEAEIREEVAHIPA